MIINFNELEKIGNKGGFETDAKIASIVYDLKRPASMFWNTKTGSLNFMRKGNPNMMIGVAPDVQAGPDTGHLVLTAHFLNGGDTKSLQNKIERGELVLLYKGESVPGISGLAEMKQPQFRRGLAEGLLPTRDAGTEADFRVRHEADMVKWEKDNWGDNPKFSKASQEADSDNSDIRYSKMRRGEKENPSAAWSPERIELAMRKYA